MSKIRLFLVFILFFSPAISHSAALLKPNISGLSGGFYKAAANDVHYANGAYSASGLASLGAYQLTLGAAIPLAANAAEFALTAARSNPYVLAGTLMLSFLMANGITQDSQGNLVKNVSIYYTTNVTGSTQYTDLTAAENDSCTVQGRVFLSYTPPATGSNAGFVKCALTAGGSWNGGAQINYNNMTTPTTQPLTDSDWSSLPDPLPTVATELPYAPYSPQGAPVSDPVYQPGDYPLSDPYSNPDNSTSQERAKVTPASGGQVNVETYSQPVTDTAGNPVANPTPTPTDTKQTECQQHPETLGCLDAGTDSFAMPTKSLTFSYTPEVSPIGNGTCPAPISVLGQSLSFQTSCDAMGMIKPLVIAIASLMAAYILLGAFRGGD